MGGLMSVFSNWFGTKERRILLLGLDAAGKTTVLFRMRLGETVHTIPTIGFNVEQVQYKNINFTIWDVGGQERIRPLWRHYYNGVNALIFVVDCNDHTRIEEAKEELDKLLHESQLDKSALLVLANKQDMPNALKVSELTSQLGLYDIKSRAWHVQSCVAVTGEGLYEGLDWLSKQLENVKA